MRIQRVVEVVPDEQIQPAVAVEVEKCRRHAPRRLVGAGLGGDVGERPVAPVAQHPIPPEARQVQIDPTVVVVVARRHTHAVAAGGQTALLRNVREAERTRPVRPNLEVVPVQPVARRLSLRQRHQRHPVTEQLALHEIDVEVPVVVVVEEARAGPHHLRLVEAARHAVEVDEVQTGLDRPVGEQLDGGIEKNNRRPIRPGRLGQPGTGRRACGQRRRPRPRQQSTLHDAKTEASRDAPSHRSHRSPKPAGTAIGVQMTGVTRTVTSSRAIPIWISSVSVSSGSAARE